MREHLGTTDHLRKDVRKRKIIRSVIFVGFFFSFSEESGESSSYHFLFIRTFRKRVLSTRDLTSNFVTLFQKFAFLF